MNAQLMSPGSAAGIGALTLVVAYLVGSIPWAYLIVKTVTGKDITLHGTGNVGAMNVRRATGSWVWFVIAALADALKGYVPTLLAKYMVSGASGGWGVALRPWSWALSVSPAPSGLLGVLGWATQPALYVPMLAVFGAVLGHNYSVWMAIKDRRFSRSGKGLATGGGALLAYDWRYCLVALAIALLTIAATRYMMAGQVAAALSLPAYAIAMQQPDWPFALLIGGLVYAAHHRRFIGLLRGREPMFYVNDGSGPRG